MSLYKQVSVLLTPHPGNFSLQHRERNTEYLQKNTTNQGTVSWNLIRINISTKQFPNVRHRIYCGRGSGMFVKGQRNKEFALRFCPPEMSESILIKSHQYGFLNLTWIRMGAIDMSNMGRGKLQRPQSKTQSYRQPKNAKSGIFPKEENTKCLFNTKISALKTYTCK